MRISFLLIFLFITSSCGKNTTTPKPPTFLRLDITHGGYMNYQSDCGYSFDIDKLFNIKKVVDENGNPLCHRDIDLGDLNGTLYFSYIDMENPLKEYVDHALNKVDEHKVMASSITDTTFLFPKKKVYGTMFELKGNVASPFQFYLTDSTSKFASGVVYFNSVPNYDSLRPTLEFVRKDIIHMIETFEW